MPELEDLIGHPESRLGEMIEATPSCLKILDRSGHLMTMNAKGLSMIEAASMEEVAGADVFSLVAAESRRDFIEFHRAVCAGHSGRLVFKLVGLKGTERLMETWAAPYVLTNGEIAHIAITNDISERQQTADMLAAQRQALELASRHAALGELAAGIAHEINNPLGVIAGFAGLMKSQLDRGELDRDVLHEKLGQIEETVARISEITDSLRTFSSDVPPERREVCELRSLVEETFGLVAERTRIGGISLENDVPESLMVNVNRVQFAQVLMNLLTNSLHAIEGLTDRWIKVTASVSGANVCMEFIDSGKGIDPEIVDKIMTPFYSTKALGEGTGLGLSISLGIMRSLGGGLRYVNGSPNTTFHLDLPSAS